MHEIRGQSDEGKKRFKYQPRSICSFLCLICFFLPVTSARPRSSLRLFSSLSLLFLPVSRPYLFASKRPAASSSFPSTFVLE